MTATLLLSGEGYGGEALLRAYDESTGSKVAQVPPPASTTGHPISYLHEGRQYVLVAVGSSTHPRGVRRAFGVKIG